MRKNEKKPKIIAAMSGGIDSSVAAALLKRAGFDVTGIFMKLTDSPQFVEGEKRAKRVAQILKIPLLVLDLKKEFKKRIIAGFLEGYKKGITPNPCVVCNKEIKFGLFLNKALKLDADFVASGHYARKIQISNLKSQNENSKCKIYKLLRARDRERDQSYFLWMLNQRQLKRILFPIGDYKRREVEEMAKEFKLSFLLNVPKSTEICFVFPDINPFLKKHLATKPGKIVDKKGKILGKHQGLWFYTNGQRKGIGLSGGPYFVLDKDLKRNLLIVTKDKRDLEKKELIAKNVNWISGKEPIFPIKVRAKIRYQAQSAPATITKILKPKTYQLEFEKPQLSITPGQSVVFYLNQEILGGGIIV